MTYIQIAGSGERVAVGKIVCVGRNYAEHAKEMRAEVPDQPVLFLKPPSALIHSGNEIVIPPISTDVHHEVELVVVISKSGKDIAEHDAQDFVLGYAVGLDMTLRDVQSEAKKKGLPWAVAKGFDTSAPVSELIPAALISNQIELEIRCAVNGTIRQVGLIRDMIFSVPKLISSISSIFSLERGDLIFTGTPEGVSRVTEGDVIEAELVGYVRTTHRVVNKH